MLAVLGECAAAGLLALAAQPDPAACVGRLRVCASVAAAVGHVDAVLECVPDSVRFVTSPLFLSW